MKTKRIILTVITAMLISSCGENKRVSAEKAAEEAAMVAEEARKKQLESDALKLVELEVKYAALYDMDHYYDLQLIAIGAVEHIRNKTAYEAYKEYQNFGLDMKIKYSDKWTEFNTLYQAMSAKVLLEKGIKGLQK